MERDAIVICLAPELRRKYDRIYAYLQDDITRRRPSVNLVLELLYPTEQQRWRAQSRLSGAAPLLRHGILRTVEDPQSPSGSSGLAQFLALDPRICQFLLGDAGLDAAAGRPRQGLPFARPGLGARPRQRRAGCCAWRRTCWRTATRHRRATCTVRPASASWRWPGRQATGWVSRWSASMRGALTGPDADLLLRLAFREGLLHGAAVHLARADVLLRDEARPLLAALAAASGDYGRLVFLTGESDWTGGDAGVAVHRSPCLCRTCPRSITIWRHSLTGHTEDAARWAEDLASRYQLPPPASRPPSGWPSNQPADGAGAAAR